MTLSDLALTPWFQSNLVALLGTPHAEEPHVKHCIALLAASKFKECSEQCESLVLSPDTKDLWRSGTPSSWLANAYSFATTVAVVTGAIVPTGTKE